MHVEDYIEFKDIKAGDTITVETTVQEWRGDTRESVTKRVTGTAHTYKEYSGTWETPGGHHLAWYVRTGERYILQHREPPKKDVPTALGSVVGDPGYDGHRLVKLDDTDTSWLGYTGNSYESRWVDDERVRELLNDHGWVEMQL